MTQSSAVAPAVLQDFLATRLEAVPGWLHPEAAHLTAKLHERQHESGIRGACLEIGIFKGKYLSLLYHLSGADEKVVGIDLFVGTGDAEMDAQTVRDNVAAACGGATRLNVIFADSTKLTPPGLREQTGCPSFRFISVDGGHTKDVVLADLKLAHGLLGEGGILALDDAFNHSTPGVIEAITEYFRDKPALAPFAHCYNKLFVTTPEHHASYLAETLKFVEEATWLATNPRTLQLRKDTKAIGFTSEMFGYEIVPFI